MTKNRWRGLYCVTINLTQEGAFVMYSIFGKDSPLPMIVTKEKPVTNELLRNLEKHTESGKLVALPLFATAFPNSVLYTTIRYFTPYWFKKAVGLHEGEVA